VGIYHATTPNYGVVYLVRFFNGRGLPGLYDSWSLMWKDETGCHFIRGKFLVTKKNPLEDAEFRRKFGIEL